MKKLYIITSTLSTLLLTSCGPVKHLVYKPVIEVSTPNNLSIAVSTTDLRIDKDEIGVAKFCDHPDVVISTNDNVSEWITKALELELQNAGYRISKECILQMPLFKVRGEVKRFWATSHPGMREGKILLDIQVLKNNKPYFQKEYIARLRPKTEWNIFKDTHTRTIEELMQKICKEFISDLNQKALS